MAPPSEFSDSESEDAFSDSEHLHVDDKEEASKAKPRFLFHKTNLGARQTQEDVCDHLVIPWGKFLGLFLHGFLYLFLHQFLYLFLHLFLYMFPCLRFQERATT